MIKSMMRKRWLVSIAIIILVLVASLVIAFTNQIPSERRYGSVNLQAVSDGSGGAVLGWYQDKKFNVGRISSDGSILWSNENLFNQVKTKQPSGISIINDVKGGAFIKWSETYEKDRDDPTFFDTAPVYVQKISADGKVVWDQEINAGSTGHGSTNQAIADGSGGLYILWNDYKTVFRALHDDYIRFQKISKDGEYLWGTDGIVIYSSPPFHEITPQEIAQGIKGTWTRSWPQCSNFRLFSDSNGEAIVVWDEETQNGNHNLYALRFNAAGQSVWKEGGVLIYGGQYLTVYSITSENSELFMLLGTGRDEFSGTSKSLIIQRLSADGDLLLGEKGAEIQRDIQSLGYVNIVNVNPHLSVISWVEGRGGPQGYGSLYVAGIDSSGEILWAKDPLISTTDPGQVLGVSALYKDQNAVSLIWHVNNWDDQAGTMFIQRLSFDGKELGTTGGSPLFTEYSYGDACILPDPSGETLIISLVGGNPLYGDSIYTQKLDSSGKKVWESKMDISN